MMKLSKKVLPMIGIIVFMLCTMTETTLLATELHVGASQTYSTPQSAWTSATNGDEIVIHAGTYAKTWNDYVIASRTGGQDTPGKSNIVIRTANDGRVTFNGAIEMLGTTDGNMGYITIDGIYINASAFVGIYIRADSGQTLHPITVRNCVIYNYTAQGIYIYGPGAHGEHIIEHNTIYGAQNATTYGFRDSMDRSGPGVPPLVRSNISVANTLHGFYSWHGGLSYTCCDAYTNGANYTPSSAQATTSYTLDPVFMSTNVSDKLFLNLSSQSPEVVLTGAHDGIYMGALPLIYSGTIITIK